MRAAAKGLNLEMRLGTRVPQRVQPYSGLRHAR